MSQIQFLNIDLDIESDIDIEPIVLEWGDRVSMHRYELMDGTYYGSFETPCGGVESIIREYCNLVEGLSPDARAIWDAASKRTFDFGYESGTAPNNFHSEISAENMSRLVKIGGNIVITIYPVQAT